MTVETTGVVTLFIIMQSLFVILKNRLIFAFEN